MAVISKPGGAATRIWYRHNTLHDLYDVLLGGAEDTAMAADSAHFTAVTTWQNTETCPTFTLTPTVMP